MQAPAAASSTPAPAPARAGTKTASKLTYEELVSHARHSVLVDFDRVQQYKRRLQDIRSNEENISVIPVGLAEEALVKVSSTRLLKEHTSSSWSIFFYQWSLFGLTGISSVSAGLGVYITVCHNRMFAPVGPIAGAIAWRLWNLLEEAWEQQRYIDYAAQIRDQRVGNPVHSIIKRRKKTESGADNDDGSSGEPRTDIA